MGICLEYTNFGSPLSGSEDAFNQAYVDGLNATFESIAVTWVETTTPDPSGVGGDWSVKYATVVDETEYDIYAPNPGLTTVYSQKVEATVLTFGAWWPDSRVCTPQWFWLMAHHLLKSGLSDYRVDRALVHQTSIGGGSDGTDALPNGYPSLPFFLYPRRVSSSNFWTAETELTATIAAGQCANPTGSAINTVLNPRYRPGTSSWSNFFGGLDTIVPLNITGNLQLSNSSGTPGALPACGI